MVRTFAATTGAVMLLVAVMAGLDLAAASSSMMPFTQRLVLLAWGPWFVGAPVIAAAGVYFRRPRWPLWSIAGVHLIACALLVGTHVVAGVLWSPTAAEMADIPPEVLSQMFDPDQVDVQPPPLVLDPSRLDPQFVVEPHTPSLLELLSLVPMYALLAISVQTMVAFAELQRRSVAEAELRTELARSQLAALRTQVQPHFLFNTLNSINALVSSDPEGARVMLTDLSELLRSSFCDDQEITLGAELELVEHYTNIQRVRFGKRLLVETDAPPDLHAARVPQLCLQPLVENSIRHAVEQSASPTRVTVQVRCEGELLQLQVQDDGPGPSSDHEPGIGLDNVRQRLRNLYGDAGQLVTSTPPGGGFATRITLPLQVVDG